MIRGPRRSAQLPLDVAVLRTLSLAAPSAPGRPAFLTAASGLVRIADRLFVVADDEHHLGSFSLRGSRPGRLLRVLDGELPRRTRARKKHKADLEVLLTLPRMPGLAHGALLALGSGSKRRRHRGVLLPLDARGAVATRRRREVDAAPLYARLARDFDALNLEGGWLSGDRLHLLQRGNKGGSPNAVIELPLRALLAALLADGVLPDLAPRRVVELDLGRVDGIPLSFTDATVLPDGSWLYSAVAEDTDDAVADGAFVGAVIGLASARHRVQWQRRLGGAHKVEGIAAARSSRGRRLLAVTDADDPAVPSRLLSIAL